MRHIEFETNRGRQRRNARKARKALQKDEERKNREKALRGKEFERKREGGIE